MVEQQTDADIDRVLHALADATRRDIVRRTLVSEQSVTQLAAAYAMSFAAVSKHIAVLAEARLITKRAEGRVRLVRADPAALERVQRLLRSYEDLWRGRIDRLDALLAEPDAETPDATASPLRTTRAAQPGSPASTPPTEN
ncbi:MULTISPECIES: helix-turn-helix transcriptional regulator [Microbacterium]|uniref:ArsR/SmtB family transcription factor n=1 Tax=Microbacterium TaxID=33882 RepID=UPI00278191F9|nr:MULTISPECIES: metalloregulator ArsR/SmtB family transcription factor [Microbacterium]MDQ1082470.1 DNA-binding transcriptional ArsR family regulator [Microbacterium sp. SORGH_AS_0344]MDQ1168759.1 DNA-binding transcriptional ArsR family regulator [Microbacterium proteolyticum]